MMSKPERDELRVIDVVSELCETADQLEWQLALILKVCCPAICTRGNTPARKVKGAGWFHDDGRYGFCAFQEARDLLQPMTVFPKSEAE